MTSQQLQTEFISPSHDVLSKVIGFTFLFFLTSVSLVSAPKKLTYR